LKRDTSSAFFACDLDDDDDDDDDDVDADAA
jgi:hypothetical protein